MIWIIAIAVLVVACLIFSGMKIVEKELERY